MHILIDLQSCQNGSRFRGIGRYALALTKSMLRLGREHTFTILLTDRFPGSIAYVRQELEGFIRQDSIVVCSLFEGTSSSDPNNAWRNHAAENLYSVFIAQFRPDIVFNPSIFEGFWDNTVVSVNPDLFRSIVTLHDLIPIEEPERYIPAQGDKEAYLRRLQDVKNAERIVTISAYVASEAKKRIAADPDQIIIALNGVDERFSPPVPGSINRTDLMKRLGISRPFVFNTSPLEYRKNLEGLIASFGSMSRNVSNTHQLVIAGKFDDYARNYLMSLIRAEGLPADTLVFTGFVSETDLIALYAECALYAFPSWSEGFGLPPLEAMACGAPTLCANTTSLPEVMGRSDLLFDPTYPEEMGAMMERILTTPKLRAELRSYGIDRASLFSWNNTARTLLSHIEKLPSPKRLSSTFRTVTGRPRLAIVSLQLDTGHHVAGRLSALIALLSKYAHVTLIGHERFDADQNAAALVELRDLVWFDWNASRFDQVLYVGDVHTNPYLAKVMGIRPGPYIELQSPIPDIKCNIENSSLLNDQYALFGMAGLFVKPQTLEEKKVILGASCRNAASEVLFEGKEGLPLLPLSTDLKSATRYRTAMGIAADVPLFVVIVKHPVTATPILQAFRRLNAISHDAQLVIHASDDDSQFTLLSDETLHMRNGIRHVVGSIYPHLRGLMSASDLLFLGEDLPTDIIKRYTHDAADVSLPTHVCAPQDTILTSLMDEIIVKCRKSGCRSASLLMSPPSANIAPWIDRILRTVDITDTELGIRMRLEQRLAGSIRGHRASSLDLGQLCSALERNMAFERDTMLCFDITAYASPNSIRRLDPYLTAHLLALIRKGGKSVCAVFEHEGKFVVANQFIANLSGQAAPFAQDHEFLVRAGDKIIGLDGFHSFAQSSEAALRTSQEHGAALIYCTVGEAMHMKNESSNIADLIIEWSKSRNVKFSSSISNLKEYNTISHSTNNILKWATRKNIHVDILDIVISKNKYNIEEYPSVTRHILSPNFKIIATAIADRMSSLAHNMSMMHYTVMGHLLGSYSLAIINRSIAMTLNDEFPNKTHFRPFETDPITHTEGVPKDEQPLMIELSERSLPSPAQEIVISQHWPIMPPTWNPRLAISLFAWEETHVPVGIIKTLASGFNAVIAPTSFVADALHVSGLRIPVATIGQPVDLKPFWKMAEARVPNQPIRRFLHVSSCFPRKGIDVLLKAWAKAFSASDNVELIIKTFPNPHNDSKEQLDNLRKQVPSLAPVIIINKDMNGEELRDLYASADAMVLPSRGEGFNLPALEAMASGLPLIVTAQGGQRDFCGPEQARLIRYRFARSTSHVQGSHAMWLEPDVEDLVNALRELADPNRRDEISTRAKSALLVSYVEGDTKAWTQRFTAMSRSLLEPRDTSPAKIAWVSTWAIQCGIAQYSDYLLMRMSSEQQKNLTIFSDYRSPTRQGVLHHENVWKFIGDKAIEIVDAAYSKGSEAIVIQHQDGLISWEQLGCIGNDPRLSTMVSIAVLHNARNLRRVSGEEAAMIINGLSKMTRILVHNIDDMNFLLGLGLTKNLGLFPHGAFAPHNTPWPRQIGASDSPIIGCHGFFFRHKGIDKLIQAIAGLKRRWPGIKLRLVNARFPGNDQDSFIQSCQDMAIKLGIEDAIEWYFDFLPVEKIEKLLGECDVIALPYSESDDSASGAVRTALATMVPLVATRVQIFSELGNAAAWAENNDPNELIRVIGNLLESPALRRNVQANMHEWLDAHDWNLMATRLENMINGLVQERRLGWNVSRNLLH